MRGKFWGVLWVKNMQNISTIRTKMYKIIVTSNKKMNWTVLLAVCRNTYVYLETEQWLVL